MTPLPDRGAGAEGRQRDELRRRLYAPGADEQDLVRYRAVAPEAEPDADPDPAVPAIARRPRLRRAVPYVGGALATAALIAALPLAQGAGIPLPTPTPVPAASGALRVPEAASARFVQALAASQPPQVAQYLVLHPSARPSAMAAATRTVVGEHQGTGTLTVPLTPDLAAGSGGRVTVVLVTDRSLPLRWTISRAAVRPDHSQYQQVVGQRALTPEPGVPLSAEVRYDGAAPTSLRVEADDGVRWDVVVAFTD